MDYLPYKAATKERDDSVPPVSLEQQILIERVKLLYHRMALGLPSNLICATLVLIGLYPVTSPLIIGIWYGSVIGVSLLRMGLLRWYYYNPNRYELHFKTCILAVYLSGVLWGIAGSLLMPENDFLHQVLVIVVVAGVTAGALQTLQPSFMASFGFVVATIGPMVVWFLLQANSVYLLICLSILAYFVFSSIISWNGYQMILETLTLRFQNTELINQLSLTNEYLQKSNHSLLETQQRFQASFDFAAIGMALVSPNGHWLKVNESLCHLLGYTEEEFLAMDFQSITHPDDLELDLNYLRQLLSGKIISYQIEKRYFHKNGDVIWTLLNVSLVKDMNHEPIYFIAQIQNIDAQKKAEIELAHMAYHDPLTNLGNRAYFEKNISQAIVNSQNTRQLFALILIDLDHFKQINDTLGHDAGDELLKSVATTLQSAIRHTDSIARLGGDEFVIILPDLSETKVVVNIARKILESMLKPLTLKDHTVYVTMSMGISLYPNDGMDVKTLMENADVALYKAKEKGRNNYQFSTAHLSGEAHSQSLDREKSLRDALLNDEFHIQYQPKLNLINKKIVGFEALLRWKSKMYGNVLPEEIIPLAEKTGLIQALSEWIFKEVAKQINLLNTHHYPYLTISINLSAREFLQPNLVENIAHFLNKNQFPMNGLEFEINEVLIMQNPEKNIPIVHALKAIGIQITIDDFGTGYSSLDYLTKFAVDRVKIDRSFIKRITTDPVARSIIKAIISMSEQLGIKAVAVGVETKEQYDFLLENGCYEVQGYYLSKPLSAKEAMSYLEKNSVIETT